VPRPGLVHIIEPSGNEDDDGEMFPPPNANNEEQGYDEDEDTDEQSLKLQQSKDELQYLINKGFVNTAGNIEWKIIQQILLVQLVVTGYGRKKMIQRRFVATDVGNAPRLTVSTRWWLQKSNHTMKPG